MKIECQNCGSVYNVPDERLREYGERITLPCPKCKEKIKIDLKTPEKVHEESPVPLPFNIELTGGDLKKRILQTVKDLRPMPQVAHKAREVIANKKSSFMDLAKVIETDQAIASRVLKIANSPYYGISRSVSSIQQASVILGMKSLYELLTLACASSVLGSELKGYQQESDEFWRHSLAVALGSKSLALEKHPDLAEDAFSAGLLHDCGKLILDQYIFDRGEDFQNFVDQGKRTFLEAEKHYLGLDHAEIASEVCEKWRIPKKLSLAIRYHHNPSKLGVNELAYIVHTADAIAMMSGIGAGIDGLLYKLDDKAMEFLELNDGIIKKIMAKIVEDVENTVSKI